MLRRRAMGVFRSVCVVAAFSMGCGGRTSGTNPSTTSGTNALGGSGAVTGSGGEGADVTSGATTAAPSEASVNLTDDGGDAQVVSACPPTAPPAVWNETPGGACAGDRPPESVVGLHPPSLQQISL